jgi:hypothetical protein
MPGRQGLLSTETIPISIGMEPTALAIVLLLSPQTGHSERRAAGLEDLRRLFPIEHGTLRILSTLSTSHSLADRSSFNNFQPKSVVIEGRLHVPESEYGIRRESPEQEPFKPRRSREG